MKFAEESKRQINKCFLRMLLCSQHLDTMKYDKSVKPSRYFQAQERQRLNFSHTHMSSERGEPSTKTMDMTEQSASIITMSNIYDKIRIEERKWETSMMCCFYGKNNLLVLTDVPESCRQPFIEESQHFFGWGVLVVKAMDCGIVVSEFTLLHWFRANTLILPAMG